MHFNKKKDQYLRDLNLHDMTQILSIHATAAMLWSRCGVVDENLAPCKPGAAGSIPGLSSLSDETLSCDPVYK